jgi:type IV secretory pathway VirB6-like protein
MQQHALKNVQINNIMTTNLENVWLAKLVVKVVQPIVVFIVILLTIYIKEIAFQNVLLIHSLIQQK